MLVTWLVLLLITVTTGRELQFKLNTKNYQFNEKFKQFLKQVYEEKPHESIYLQRTEPRDCIDENLQSYLKLPVISMDIKHLINLKEIYSSSMLAIMCIKNIEDKVSLKTLAANLQLMRTTRVIVLVNEDFIESTIKKISDFFEECEQLRILNINLLHRDYFRTLLYHSYTQFPQFQLEIYKLTPATTNIFPDRLKNLQQKSVLVLPDQGEPRTMLYTDAKGQQKMIGYMGKFIHTFAKYYNCSLKFPENFSSKNPIHLSDVSKAAFNNSVDIGVCLSTARISNIKNFTYPIELVKWVVMIPVEPLQPLHSLLSPIKKIDLFFLLLLINQSLSLLLARQVAKAKRVPISLLQVFCNDSTFRGILGQAFKLQRSPTFSIKYLYVLIFSVGLFYSTYFSANLTKGLSARRTQTPISSWDDALLRKLKIKFSEQDISGIEYFRGKPFWKKFSSMFHVVKPYSEFQAQRRNAKLPFGYLLVTSMWPMINERQKFFQTKRYRLSQELSICNFMVLGMPLNENSIYKEPLDNFIQKVKANGLLKYWYGMTFYDMVALHKISFHDWMPVDVFPPLNVGDLYWAWIGYIVSISFSSLVFAFEHYVMK